MTDWFLILAGLVSLIVGAELLVRGAVWIALALGVSKLTVGLTVVAFGTSAPELVVSLIDVLKPDSGAPEPDNSRGAIALGNVFGSNLANVGLILGLTAALRAVTPEGPKLRFEAWWLILASLLTLKPLVWGGEYTRLDGGVLFGLVLLFTALLLRRERRSDNGEPIDREGSHAILNVAFLLLGLAGLIYGGQWLVDGARGVADSLGMSQALIGATIVAVGTSLPELATALVAARKGHPELALGNVVGSNIFNICMVLGITASIRPLPVEASEYGLLMGLGVVLAVMLGVLLLSRARISRRSGVFLLVCYLTYLTTAVMRS